MDHYTLFVVSLIIRFPGLFAANSAVATCEPDA
jgi:hypothetical protein